MGCPAAGRVDQFVANSMVTQERIAKHYGRLSVVLYPPIETGRFTPGPERPEDYYLVASRNVPYKRIDLAVEATRLAGRKLVIAGCRSEQFEAPHVQQIGHVSDQTLLRTMRKARALLFPGLEDFGMTPVEMMSCGRPVIAFAQGGAVETVIDGVTGVLVKEQRRRPSWMPCSASSACSLTLRQSGATPSGSRPAASSNPSTASSSTARITSAPNQHRILACIAIVR